MNNRFNLRRLCILAVFTAVTAILSIYCTFRIGTAIKIPFKFTSVFLTASVMGPLYGGLVALLGDLANVIFAPSGPWLFPITILEFLNGFIFGLFFYNRAYSGKGYILRALICTLILFLIDIFATSYILTFAGYFPNIMTAITLRLTAGILKAIIQFVFLIFSASYIKKFKAIAERQTL